MARKVDRYVMPELVDDDELEEILGGADYV